MFEIEKDVPIPDISKGRDKYRFSEMEVGDSILFPSEVMKNVASRAHAYGVRKGVKFTTRKEGDGMRIWRIA